MQKLIIRFDLKYLKHKKISIRNRLTIETLEKKDAEL